MHRAALISPCGKYRYALLRRWGRKDAPHVLFCMLNPSKADGLQDDPTVRRCIGFARAWNYAGLYIVNLYAYRSTKPERLLQVECNVVGQDNDLWIAKLAAKTDIQVCAWGDWGARVLSMRPGMVRRMLPRPYVLHLSGSGVPGHPLFLPASLKPRPW